MEEKTLQIYTDAGGKPESYGLGVFFIKPDEKEEKYCYRTNLDLLIKEFNVEKGTDNTTIIETYAIIKALENVKETYDKIIIYTDSLQTYDVLNVFGKHLRDSILYQSIVSKYRELVKDKNVEIRWIKSHCGVYGNEIADQLSTRAKNVNRDMPFCNEPYDAINKINLALYEFNFSFKLDKHELLTNGKKYDI